MLDLLRPFFGGSSRSRSRSRDSNGGSEEGTTTNSIEIMNVDLLLNEVFDRLNPLLMSNDPTYQSQAFDSLQEIVETLSDDYGLNSKEIYADFIIRLLISAEEKGVNFDWDNYESDGTEICYPIEILDDNNDPKKQKKEEEELPSFFEPFLSQQQQQQQQTNGADEFQRCLLSEEDEYTNFYNDFYGSGSSNSNNNINNNNEYEISIDVILTLLPIFIILWFVGLRKLFNLCLSMYYNNAANNNSSAIMKELLAEEEEEKAAKVVSSSSNNNNNNNHKRYNKSKKKKKLISSSSSSSNNKGGGSRKKQPPPPSQSQQLPKLMMAGFEKQINTKEYRPRSEPIQAITVTMEHDDDGNIINRNNECHDDDDDDEPVVVVEAVVVEEDDEKNAATSNINSTGGPLATANVHRSSCRDEESEEQKKEESASMMMKGLEREDEEDETTTSNTTFVDDDASSSEQEQRSNQNEQNQSLETAMHDDEEEEENESILLRQEEDQLLEECILASLQQEQDFEGEDDDDDAYIIPTNINEVNPPPISSMIDQGNMYNMMNAFSLFSPTSTTTTTTTSTENIIPSSPTTNVMLPVQVDHSDYRNQLTEQNDIVTDMQQPSTASTRNRKQKPKRKPKQQQKEKKRQPQTNDQGQKEKEATVATAADEAVEAAGAKKQREVEEQAALMIILEAKRKERIEFWKTKLNVANDYIQPLLHLLACEYACRIFPSCLEEGSRSAIDLLLEDTNRRKVLETQARIGFDKLFPNECIHLRATITANSNNNNQKHKQKYDNNKNNGSGKNKKQNNYKTRQCNKIGIVREWDDNAGKLLLDFSSSSASAAAAAAATKNNTFVGKRRNKYKNRKLSSSSSYYLPEQVEPIKINSDSDSNSQTIPSDSIEAELNLVPPKIWIGLDDSDSDSDTDEQANVRATVVVIERSTIIELMTADDPNKYLDMYTQRYREEQCLKKQIAENERISKEQACRVTFWKERMEFEKLGIARIVVLLATEFCRQQKNYGAPERSILMEDKAVQKKLEEQAKQTLQELFSNEIPQRVVIRGEGCEDLSKNLNSRTGTIQHWDETKQKYCIILDAATNTKKRNNKTGGCRQQRTDMKCYLNPKFLEALSYSSKPSASSSKKKKKQRRNDSMGTASLAYIASLYKDDSLMFEVDKSTVDSLLEQVDDDAVDKFLDVFCLKQDQIQEKYEEEERKREEQARRRRAEKLRREEEEQKRIRQAFLERMAQIREQSSQLRQQQQRQWTPDVGRESNEDDGNDDFGYEAGRNTSRTEGPYSREEFQHLFKEFFGSQQQSFGGASNFFHPSGSGGTFFMDGGGNNFFARFDDDFDSNDDSEKGDYRWGAEFDRLRKEEMAGRNAMAADLLGVEPDATVEEINRKFRRLGLQHHPDRYKTENHAHWMSQEKSEERFRELADARDEMLLYRERGEL